MKTFKIDVTLREQHLQFEADDEKGAIRQFIDMVDDGDFFPAADDYMVSAKEIEAE